jgi:hypothetical protein
VLWKTCLGWRLWSQPDSNDDCRYMAITVAARSPPARTLGTWDRIPLEAWTGVCVYFVLLLSYV